MESANVFVGSDEDCRSCESGWTMYLASQSQDHNDNYHYEDDDNEEEEESDGGDSMDSDASSGPMEATSGDLKTPQKIEDQNSVKKKKTNEKMVMVETTRANDDDDDDGDDHDYDDGNDNYSVVHSYVGSV